MGILLLKPNQKQSQSHGFGSASMVELFTSLLAVIEGGSNFHTARPLQMRCTVWVRVQLTFCCQTL